MFRKRSEEDIDVMDVDVVDVVDASSRAGNKAQDRSIMLHLFPLLVCRQMRRFLQSWFLVTFVADTNERSVGVKPACTEATKEIPPRPLGVGVVDEDRWRRGIPVHGRQIVVCGCFCGVVWCGENEGGGVQIVAALVANHCAPLLKCFMTATPIQGKVGWVALTG